MTEHTVTIAAALNPDPLTIITGDTVVWVNNTPAVQTAGSIDGGQTFTTGPIQPNADSMPITVRKSTPYTVSPAGLSGNITVNMALSFAADIKPLFTAMDQDHMLNQIGLFDLWSYADVKANADAIYSAVKNGNMPPPGSGESQWPASQVDKFKQWIDGGLQP